MRTILGILAGLMLFAGVSVSTADAQFRRGWGGYRGGYGYARPYYGNNFYRGYNYGVPYYGGTGYYNNGYYGAYNNYYSTPYYSNYSYGTYGTPAYSGYYNPGVTIATPLGGVYVR